MATCGQQHETFPDVVCDSAPGNHRWHTGWRDDLDQYLDWPNTDYVPPKRHQSRTGARQKLQEAAGRVAPATHVAPGEGIAQGLAESQRAAGRWDEEQKQLVLAAIIAVAKREDEFTSDAIWNELAGRVPVTKGLTALLMLASKRNILGSTGKTEISRRGGEHDHGQRLTVWYSLIQEK